MAAAFEQRAKLRRNITEVRAIFKHGGESIGEILAVESALACDEFVQHNTEGADVGALVDGLAAGLFGAHVCSGAQNHDVTLQR